MFGEMNTFAQNVFVTYHLGDARSAAAAAASAALIISGAVTAVVRSAVASFSDAKCPSPASISLRPVYYQRFEY